MLRVFFVLFIFFGSLFSSGLKDISVDLLWKNQFEFAGYYMAIEKGFYKDAGLNVKLNEYHPGMDIVNDVLTSKADFGIGYPTLVKSRADGKKIVLLQATFQASPHVLVSSKKIKSIGEFKGKRIMINSNALDSASFLAMFKVNDIKLSDMKIVKESFNVKDFINKKCDIMSVYISDEVYALKKLGYPFNIWDPKDYGFDFYNNILFTSEKFAKKSPSLVNKFNIATKLGWEYAFSHIEESVNVILNKYNTQHKSKDALLYEAKVLKKLAYYHSGKFGKISIEKLRMIYDVYKLLGYNGKKIDWESFVFNFNTFTLKEKEWIKKHVIRVGVSPWYPITYYDTVNHKAIGVGIDFLNILAKKFHLKIEYIPQKWSKLLELFKEKKIDLLPTTFYTKERAKYGDFTSPYLDIEESLYVREDSHIEGFEDLKNRRVAVVAGYGAIEKIKEKYPYIRIVEAETLSDTIGLLLNKRVDAIFNAKYVMETFIKNNYIKGLKEIKPKYLNHSELHFFINKDMPVLSDIMQKGANYINSKVNKSEILLKWILSNNKIVTKTDFLSKKERDYLKKHRVIKMCNNPNWAPIEFAEKSKKKDGNKEDMKGIAIDILHLLEKRVNIKFENVPTKSWSESQKFLKEKKCDILPAAIKTSKREKYAIFTHPYLVYKLAIITKNDKPFVGSIDKIKDKVIARKKGSGLITVLKKRYPNIKILETKDYLEALKAVANSKAYATIATLPVTSYYINKFSISNLYIAGYMDMQYKLSIAVRNDKKILRDILDKALYTVTQKDKNKIHKKWVNISLKEKMDWKLIKAIVISFFIIIAVILYFLIKIKMINAKLNERIKEAIEKNTLQLQQLQQQSRLAQMGEMIAMIAHQWRQPLTAISATSSSIMLKAKLNKLDNKQAIEMAKKISEYSQHLSSTINDFRDFFKTNKKLTLSNIDELILNTLNIIETSIKNKNINIIKVLKLKDASIMTYPNELKQVVLNLLKNAEDVILEKDIKNPYIKIKSYKEGDAFVIEVADNAGGIPEEIMDKIFDPYFSTKTKKDGTGLGLYMSKTIVEEHCGGKLMCRNGKKGAIFKIILKDLRREDEQSKR